MLYIVVFFVELLLGFGKETICTDSLFDLNLTGWQFLRSLAIVIEHAGFASLSLGLLLCLLLLIDALLLLSFFLTDDDGRGLHSSNVSLSHNGCFSNCSVAFALCVDVSAQFA